MSVRPGRGWTSERLRDAIADVVERHPVVKTVGRAEVNRLMAIRDDGVSVETSASKEPQLVDAWMFEVAWEHLNTHGSLESRELQSNDGLKVKRSAAVMAVLAMLPGVGSAPRPARLFLGEADPLATPNPPWDPEERAAALELYLRRGLVPKTDPELIELSERLRTRAQERGIERNTAFRNPAGVALKLANFAAMDPSHGGAGMSRSSRGDVETWDTFAGDRDELARYVDQLSHGGAHPWRIGGGSLVPIERQHVVDYVLTVDQAVRSARRTESTLVIEFATWLESQGRKVSSDRHDVDGGALRPDLLDHTEQRIWEAKSEVGRNAIRLAIGQLIDYRRFRPTWSIGVLLPHRPSDDLVDLCRAAGASLAYRAGSSSDGFTLE